MVNKVKTCRCCLSEMDLDSELYEFSSEVSIDSETTLDPQNFIKIGECFASVTTIEIKLEDEDTSKICSQCLGDLKFCYMFQKKCLESDKTYSSEEDQGENLFVGFIDWIFTKAIVNIAEHIIIIRDAKTIKSEEYDDSNVIEYVEEEYVDDMNDEDTNDGFEDEHGNIKDDDESQSDKRQSLESIEQAEGTS